MKQTGDTRIISPYANNENCCGCGACLSICPKQAITMLPDKHGFTYPLIDLDICIRCGLCNSACGYQAEVGIPQITTTYVAVSKSSEILKTSTSGGVFASLAIEIIKRGGVAFGCSMERKNGKLTPAHIMIETVEYLNKLQGSKYVQSDIGLTYAKAKKELIQGRQVLFSGTPCQIDGLKHFLNMQNYDNLLTAELICHGVPSAQMFQDYIECLEKKINGKIIDFKFRDKGNGWGLNGKVIYMKDGIIFSKEIAANSSSFYKLFLTSRIYRESCYSCKYASANRAGDLTIGDFWGVEIVHPEYLSSFDSSKGVSCVIANTIHGSAMLKELCSDIALFPSTFAKASRENMQLKRPSSKSDDYNYLFDIYVNDGYQAVERWLKKREGIRYYINFAKNLLPYKLKQKIKRLWRLLRGTHC